MGKPQASIRRPPAAKDLSDFVNGGATSSPVAKVTSLPIAKATKGLHERASGKVVRKVSVYLSPEVAKALKLHALEAEENMSEVVERSLRVSLGL